MCLVYISTPLSTERQFQAYFYGCFSTSNCKCKLIKRNDPAKLHICKYLSEVWITQLEPRGDKKMKSPFEHFRIYQSKPVTAREFQFLTFWAQLYFDNLSVIWRGQYICPTYYLKFDVSILQYSKWRNLLYTHTR